MSFEEGEGGEGVARREVFLGEEGERNMFVKSGFNYIYKYYFLTSFSCLIIRLSTHQVFDSLNQSVKVVAIHKGLQECCGRNSVPHPSF